MNYMDHALEELRKTLREAGYTGGDERTVMAVLRAKLVESFVNGKDAGRRARGKNGAATRHGR